jgi:hypothetical protein
MAWFEDHIDDFRMWNYEADCEFEDIPLRFKVSPELVGAIARPHEPMRRFT